MADWRAPISHLKCWIDGRRDAYKDEPRWKTKPGYTPSKLNELVVNELVIKPKEVRNVLIILKNIYLVDMSAVSEIDKQQNEKWCGLEALLEAVSRKKEFGLEPKVVPEVNDGKCGLRVNPWKNAVHFHQNKLPESKGKSLDRQSSVNSCARSYVANHERFAPPKKNTIYAHQDNTEKNLIHDSVKTATLQIKPNAETLKPISYVLPVESFRNFKVLVPTDTLEMQTEDGEVVVVDRCDETRIQLNNVVKPNFSSSNINILRHHEKNLSVLEMLTGHKLLDKNITRWEKYDKCFVYFTNNNKRYTINSETGSIAYDDVNTSGVVYDTNSKGSAAALCSGGSTTTETKFERQYEIPRLERNLFIPWTSCSKSTCKTWMYNSIVDSIHNKRKNTKSVLRGKLVLKKLTKKHRLKRAAQFVVYSTKFGSFMERCIPEVNLDHNYIRRDVKAEEEKLLLEIKAFLPTTCMLDPTRLGILKGSISYIQCLEKKLKESLGIFKPAKRQSKDEINNYASLFATEVLQQTLGYPNTEFDSTHLSIFHTGLKDQHNLRGSIGNPRVTVLEDVLQGSPHTVEIPCISPNLLGIRDIDNGNVCERLYNDLIECAVYCSSLETMSCIETNYIHSCTHLNGLLMPDKESSFVTIKDILKAMQEYKRTEIFHHLLGTQSMDEFNSSCPPSKRIAARWSDGVMYDKKESLQVFSDGNQHLSDLGRNMFLSRVEQSEENLGSLCPFESPSQSKLFPLNDDDVLMSRHDDARFQMNYIDVNLNSLSNNDDDNDNSKSPVCTPVNHRPYHEDILKNAREERHASSYDWKNMSDCFYSPTAFVRLNCDEFCSGVDQ